MNQEKPDGRHIASLGESKFRQKLTRSGIQFAQPLRDRGIDLVAYKDKGRFHAVPIQIKSSWEFRWVVHKQYDAFPDILIALVMYLGPERPMTIHLLPHTKNVAIAKRLGYMKGATWLNRGYVWITNDTPKLLQELQPYLVTNDNTDALLWHRRS